MNNHHFFAAIFLVLAGIFLAACSLEEQNPSPYQHPLSLQAEKDYSLVRLQWNAVNVTGFKEYILLQSTQAIPDAPEPEISQNVSVLKRFDDKDATSFVASNALFSPVICYKLYASIEDRFLQSGNICVHRDLQILSGFYDRAAHEDGRDEMILFDRLNHNLTVYNYREGSILSTSSTSGLSFPVLEISSWNGTTHLFAFDQSSARLQKYNFPVINIPVEKYFSGYLYSARSFHQFVFTATEEPGNSFKVLSRANLSVLDYKDGQLSNRVIAAFEGDPVIVLDISDARINQYGIDPNGKITLLGSKTPGISQSGTTNTTAQGQEVFIAGRNGNIVDREANLLGTLISDVGSFMHLTRLSDDEQKAVYIFSDNTGTKLEIADITNKQDIRLQASYAIPSASYADLIVEDDIIYIIGVSFDSGQAQTFVLKYPMS